MSGESPESREPDEVLSNDQDRINARVVDLKNIQADSASKTAETISPLGESGIDDGTVSAADRDKDRYGDLSHLPPHLQQKARDQMDSQSMVQAAADSYKPGGSNSEVIDNSGPLADGAITGIPDHLKNDEPER